jgi:hypothetical protein
MASNRLETALCDLACYYVSNPALMGFYPLLHEYVFCELLLNSMT